MRKDPTFLGTVEDVRGSTVGVILSEKTCSGLLFVDGRGYRVGQLGSFIKISIGFIDLFGLVTQVGASAVPERKSEYQVHGHRWITVQLIGEGTYSGGFNRGLSQYPTIGDPVHIITDEDLKNIYGRSDSPQYIKIGHLSSSDSIPALIDINRLISRHSAVVGSTGTGKSTTITSILNNITEKNRFRSARVLIFDIHGEYANALKDHSVVFKINANPKKNEKELNIPYWALNYEELLSVSFGNNMSDIDRGGIQEEIIKKKKNALKISPRIGVEVSMINVDTPIPFSLHSLWLELYKLVIATHTCSQNQSLESVAYELDDSGNCVEKGNALQVKPPKFRAQQNNKVYISHNPLNIRRPLEALSYKLRDSRLDFLFRPGDWLPNDKGVPIKDLDELLLSWLGHDKNITILDLSGVPRDILNILIGAILRIIYDSLFWARNLPEGGRERPLLLILEEAHAYLGKGSKNFAASAVKRIVKEGRKYGIGAMIVSQRPSEIDSTILSQCGTFFAMRLSNSQDRNQIISTVSENMEGLLSLLPILRTGEAIILGESVHIPIRTLIEVPPKHRCPDSQDPFVYTSLSTPGGWNKDLEPQNYSDVLECWRKQDIHLSRLKNIKKNMEVKSIRRRNVSSSNIASIGYDDSSQTLEIEFLQGQVYQYFDVPQVIYDQFLTASSKGQYFHGTIKSQYRYVRM